MINKIFTITSLAVAMSLGVQVQNLIETVVMPRGSTWKYLDNGSDQGTAWYGTNFNDSTWARGRSKLGYGRNNEATVVSFGPSSSNKYPCTYFRTNFNITTLPSGAEVVGLKILRDDGVVVYINGQEVLRDNMPVGNIGYRTMAASNNKGASESTYFYFEIPDQVLRLGNNVIAASVHQDQLNSSDLGFDFEIVYSEFRAPQECDANFDSLHISRFDSVLPSSQPDSMRIPETHTFQMIVQQGDPYTNPADGNTKGLFDFTGYVPKDGMYRPKIG